jgi:RNA polymerase primary sigma factor
VLGFHDPSSDEPKDPRRLAGELQDAVARYFFPALFKGELAVRIETYEDRAGYLESAPSFGVDVDARKLKPHIWTMLSDYQDMKSKSALVEDGDVVSKKVRLVVPRRKERPTHPECEHLATLVVRQSGPEDGPIAAPELNKLAVFRGPGMVIEYLDLKGICLGARPFHAVLFAGMACGKDTADRRAEEFLRTAEPPAHNSWTSTQELKAAYVRGCITRLRDFLKQARSTVHDIVKPLPRELADGPKSLRELFRLGGSDDSRERGRPRVTRSSGSVNASGQWVVEARVRLKARQQPLLLSPALYFAAETGVGQAVAWQAVEALSGCSVVDGVKLRVEPGRSRLRFKGVTDADSHPVPAASSTVYVDIRRTAVLSEETAR